MMLEAENLAGKHVLEVGSGRGDTTRILVSLLRRYPGTALTVTDVSDAHFHELEDAFAGQPIPMQFFQTDACMLAEIPPGSIDYVVCNYTLCSVNAQAGRVVFALRRFWDVLRDGGKLYIEEEFPIDKKDTPAQAIWSDKWRILKAAAILGGSFPFNELEPETLAELCRLAGFKAVEWSPSTSYYPGAGSLDFFQARLSKMMKDIPNRHMKKGLTELAYELTQRATRTGGMEIPYYRLYARKTTAK
jgi:ubiquinone/menaquinone biosynthesis C-methylase UbiE